MYTEPRPAPPSRSDPVKESPGRGSGPRERDSLWVYEPVGTPRMPDSVRSSAVRAVLVGSVTIVEATVAYLAAVGGSWFAAPALLCTVASTVVATWAVLDVWVTRQMWNQRHGVLSSPSSAARSLRRERRRERRAARASSRSRRRDPAPLFRV